jgi:hypothetical protein
VLLVRVSKQRPRAPVRFSVKRADGHRWSRPEPEHSYNPEWQPAIYLPVYASTPSKAEADRLRGVPWTVRIK